MSTPQLERGKMIVVLVPVRQVLCSLDGVVAVPLVFSHVFYPFEPQE